MALWQLVHVAELGTPRHLCVYVYIYKVNRAIKIVQSVQRNEINLNDTHDD